MKYPADRFLVQPNPLSVYDIPPIPSVNIPQEVQYAAKDIAASIINSAANSAGQHPGRVYIWNAISNNQFNNMDYANIFELACQLLLLFSVQARGMVPDGPVKAAVVATSYYMSALIVSDKDLASRCSGDIVQAANSNYRLLQRDHSQINAIINQRANPPQYQNNYVPLNTNNGMSGNIPYMGTQNLTPTIDRNSPVSFREFDKTMQSYQIPSFRFDDLATTSKPRPDNPISIPVVPTLDLIWKSSYIQPYRTLLTDDYKSNLRKEQNCIIEDITLNKNQHQLVQSLTFGSGLRRTKVVEDINTLVDSHAVVPQKDEVILTDVVSKPRALHNSWIATSNFANLINETRLKMLLQPDTITVYRVFGIIYTHYYGTNSQSIVTELANATSFDDIKFIIKHYQEVGNTYTKAMLQSILNDLNRYLQEFIIYKLSLPSIVISGFMEDVSDMGLFLKEKYGERYSNAFSVYEDMLLRSFCKPSIVSAMDIIFEEAFSGINEKHNVEITLIPTTYSLTCLNMLYLDLGLQINDNIGYLINPDITPALNALAKSVYEQNKAMVHPDTNITIPALNNYIITSDNIVLEVHKALLLSNSPDGDRYLLSKPNNIFI